MITMTIIITIIYRIVGLLDLSWSWLRVHTAQPPFCFPGHNCKQMAMVLMMLLLLMMVMMVVIVVITEYEEGLL